MTCLIQKYPAVCMIRVAPSIMCPMRSVKSTCICSGLMYASAIERNSGSSWSKGDYDYNGAVTLDDFTLFLGGYQRQGPPL